MVTIFDDGHEPRRRWRSRPSCARRGLRVEVYPEADKLGKQFKYASSRGTCRSSRSSATTRRARGEVSRQGPAARGEQQAVPRARQVADVRRAADA